MLTHSPAPLYDVFKFRRFRLNLISFLRLPLSVNENDLREVIKECSVNLHAGYVARAERAILNCIPGARSIDRSVKPLESRDCVDRQEGANVSSQRGHLFEGMPGMPGMPRKIVLAPRRRQQATPI